MTSPPRKFLYHRCRTIKPGTVIDGVEHEDETFSIYVRYDNGSYAWMSTLTTYEVEALLVIEF